MLSDIVISHYTVTGHIFICYEVDIKLGSNMYLGFPRRKFIHSLAEKDFLQMRGFFFTNWILDKRVSVSACCFLNVLLMDSVHRYFYATASLFCDFSTLSILTPKVSLLFHKVTDELCDNPCMVVMAINEDSRKTAESWIFSLNTKRRVFITYFRLIHTFYRDVCVLSNYAFAVYG